MSALLRAAATVLAVLLTARRVQRGAPPPERPLASPPPPAPTRRERWKQRALTIGVFLVLAGLLGALVAVSGVVPITASGGHWAITEWFLHFAMRRSVETHAIPISAPSLDDAALVLRGAGHYEGGCRPCHGAPGVPLPVIPQQMTAAPPELASRVAEWQPEELFYIVKHGLKMTSMPAWPALEREDEVWAVVAFLLELPTLDAAGYRRLVHGDEPAAVPIADLEDLAAEPAVAASCARCHGADGRGRGLGAFPALAGQRERYLANALDAYASGERASGIMQPIAAGLTAAERRELAAWYAGLPGLAEVPAGAAASSEGQDLAEHGLADERIPACAACHGPAATRANPAFPLLGGQSSRYLRLQLQLLRDGHRGGSRWVELMQEFAHQLEDEHIRAVAAYYGEAE